VRIAKANATRITKHALLNTKYAIQKMSYLRGKEALMAWFDAHNEDATEPKPYWTIYSNEGQHKAGKAVFAKSSDLPNLSYKESKILFVETNIKCYVTNGYSPIFGT
jgi:hypothetical protein